MPKSVVGNWLAEFKRWLPQIKVCNLIARKECREDIIKN
jgi:SNF2 family DNA or RNA helicase